MLIKQTLDTKKIREDFPIFKQLTHNKPLIYLDNGATSQKPVQVIDAMNRFYNEYNSNVHRGVYKISELATHAYEEAHRKTADFIKAEFEEVIFTKGTTESLNLLAYTLGRTLKQGDEIVLSQMEHHSNLVPWQQLAKQKGLALKFIRITKDYKLDMAHAREIITPKTKIVSIVHVSNVLGTINPVKELAALAHKNGALFVIDGAQSIQHLPINVKELDCDFFAFSGHKMLGPTGIGVLYGKRHLLEHMEPFLYGGDMISEVQFEHSTWNELPWKFEAGTPNITEAIGLAAAIDYLKEINMEHIKEYEEELTTYALETLSNIKGVRVYGPTEAGDRGSVIAFNVEGIHPHDVSTILDREGIAVRGGHHCAMPLMNLLGVTGTVRASFSFYNTTEEIDKLAQAIKKAQEVFK
ncbi:MAG: cysteine desulfurase [Candidatus Aenigmarchaeota archaeon]|nr:cysteine desulfurase [Candidatus Aenigmarchaeota archaeon]